MARPGDATCPRCASRRTLPGWVRGRALPNRSGDVFEPLDGLWFQFTFPATFFARWFDRGHRRAIRPEFDLCLDCGLLWATLDPAGIEAEIRQATGAEVFGKPTPRKELGVLDAELDGPIR